MSRKTERLRVINSPHAVPRFLKILTNLKYRLIVEGVAVGALAGILVSAFRVALSKADEMRTILVEAAHEKFIVAIWCLLLLAFLAAGIAFIVLREPMCSGSGIPQVKGELEGKIKAKWLNVIIAKFAGGVLSMSAGLALGREGPSIQLGAMTGKGFSRLSGRFRNEEKLLMTCGAGAGLAAAFGAPLAGVVFALEELHKNFSTDILLSTMAAAITGDWVASSIFGLKPAFSLHMDVVIPLSHYWMIILLGILLGALGVLYNRCIALSQNFFGSLKPAWLKVVIPCVVIIILAAIYPVALGSGHNLVESASWGTSGIKTMAVLLAVKFVFSIMSFGTGAPGGIFLPLLVLGALSGGLFAQLVSACGGCADSHVAYFVILGMAGMFASIVRAPVTGIILISEMTRIFYNMLPLAIVTFVAYITAEMLGGVPIYDQLLDRFMSMQKSKQDRRKTINVK
ncbi:MAG: ClC family H(+)/Cl(-) exchange transporter [Firmicutes bacterium]|nr:ClC family H(+)/Cl(-) exchange transporter [Bacillota bacterium]